MKLIGFYDNFEFEEYPLAFIPLHSLTAEQKLALLTELDLLYGDTDQDTTDYALEYQVVMRMLLHESWFPINLKYLALPECVSSFKAVLNSENYAMLEKAVEMDPAEILKQYEERDD